MCGVGAFGTAPQERHAAVSPSRKRREDVQVQGNGIDPREVTDKYGADVLRLWVASTDYSVDVSIGDTILQRTSDAYRRFRNTFRFLLGNLDGFDWERDRVDFVDLKPIDVWAMLRLREVLHEVERAMTVLFHSVFARCTTTSSPTCPPSTWTSSRTACMRRRRTPCLVGRSDRAHEHLEVMVRVMSPILSFTCDEVGALS
ncbi:MAG: class I tRNA ligase family protein [Eggerthellaceae bacterium]